MLLAQMKEAVDFINTKTQVNPTIGIILGTGLGGLVKEIEIIDERVKDLVDECEKFAEESPYPEAQQLYDVVYEQENYPFIPHKL